MFDVYEGSRNDVSMLPWCAFLKQKESKTTKANKKQQQQKRGERLA